MAATTEEANTWLLFSSCGCTQEVKLNVERQMALLLKKVNIDFMDKIASLAALHFVKNCKLCITTRRYLAAPQSTRFYTAGTQKPGVVLGASAGDYKWNKKAGIVAFCFLCWEYLLSLISVFGIVGVLFSINTQIIMNQYLTTYL